MSTQRNDTTPEVYTEEQDGYRPFNELSESGLLWLINTTTFWPRGYSLGIEHRATPEQHEAGENGEAVGWKILGDGKSAWRASSDEVMDARFAAVAELLAAVTP
jgi:hypothetical protein